MEDARYMVVIEGYDQEQGIDNGKRMCGQSVHTTYSEFIP